MKDVHDYAVKYLKMDGRAILRVYPRSQITASEEKTDMTVEPEAAPIPSFVPPTMQKAFFRMG